MALYFGAIRAENISLMLSSTALYVKQAETPSPQHRRALWTTLLPGSEGAVSMSVRQYVSMDGLWTRRGAGLYAGSCLAGLAGFIFSYTAWVPGVTSKL